MKTEYHILLLGAGKQSSTLYMMGHYGELYFDAAIFADTREESQATLNHLQWLDNLHSIPIYIISKGRLGDDLSMADSTGKRCASIPAFMATKKGGMVRRQCTSEYKTSPIEQCLRRDILGLSPRQRVSRTIKVHLYFGISADEARRTAKILKRVSKKKWQEAHFPLIHRWMTRRDCEVYLADKIPHPVPKSACVFCPFKDDHSWLYTKQHDPVAWDRAVFIDRKLREPGIVVNKKLRGKLYLHRAKQPLETIDFAQRIHDKTDHKTLPMFTEECEGMCGN